MHLARKPGHLQHFYSRIERKKGNRIVKVATARKLLEWIYHMLKDGRTYQQLETQAARKGELVYVTGYKRPRWACLKNSLKCLKKGFKKGKKRER